MSKSKTYTDEFYEESAQAAWNLMGTGEYYSKAQVLELAGFEDDQRQHWPKLRRGSGRLGLPVEYIRSQGWRRGNGSGVIQEWDKRIKLNAKSMRSNIIGHLQKADGAQQAVAYLLESGHNPISIPIILQQYGAGLPPDIVAELVAATVAMLPEMDRETRDKLMATSDEVRQIAGLLKAPQ